MTTFIVTFSNSGSALGSIPWTMIIDAANAKDAVDACVAAHPGCVVLSVKARGADTCTNSASAGDGR